MPDENPIKPKATSKTAAQKLKQSNLKQLAEGHASQAETILSSLLNAVYWVDDSLQARLQAKGWSPISHAKSMVMINVFDGVTRPSDLAKKMGVSRQAMHKTIQEMERDGLLVIRPDPKDKRANTISYNKDSIEMIADAFDALVQIEKDLAQRVGQNNLEQMRHTLEKDWGPISKD